MSKVITSPVKRYPGTVTLSDPLSYPQFFALSDGYDAVAELHRQAEEQGKEAAAKRVYACLLPGICKCVEAWNLKGLPETVTPDNFPSSPARASDRLAGWLIVELTAIYIEEDDDSPNE